MSAVLESPGFRTNSHYPKFLECKYTFKSGRRGGSWQFVSDDLVSGGGIQLGSGDEVKVVFLLFSILLYIIC